MNILYISDHFQPYGTGAANISTFLIAKALSKLNTVFIITQKFQLKPWSYKGLVVTPILPRYSSGKSISDIVKTEFFNLAKLYHFFSFSLILWKFCRKNKIDVINVQSNNLVLVSAALFLKTPLVIDVRDYGFTCRYMLKTEKCTKHHLFCLPSSATKRGLLGSILSRIFFRYQTVVYFLIKNLMLKPLLYFNRNNAVFVANSKYVKKSLMREFKNQKIKCKVIYNTLNTQDYKNVMLTRKKKNYILYASELENSKGIWDVIYSAESLRKSNTIFQIVGDGPESAAIKDYIFKKNLKNVKLYGRLEYKRLPKFYKEAYISVQPSVWPEPFGRYILESFASLTPLITTPTGGTTESVVNNKTGILVPVNDYKRLTKAILKIVSNRKLYNNIRKGILKNVEKFNPENIAKRRINLYHSLAG